MTLRIFIMILLGIFQNAFSQTTISKYDHGKLFSPVFYPTGESITSAATGGPNTGYWQNKADYKITASLDDVKNEITGTVHISYKNNSPHDLGFLWLQLDQNFFD